MRIILYLILFLVSVTFILSCSKGGPVQDPQFGNVLLSNSLLEDVNVVNDADNRLLKTKDILQWSMPMGKNRIKFYMANSLLLDTVLSVQPYEINKYTLFKSTDNANLKVLDASFNGLNTEVIPDSGFVKFCIANFSRLLPGKVNIDVLTTTYTASSLKTIQVGQILNVSSSFSSFQTFMIGIDQSPKQRNEYTLLIKDAINNSVLATVPLAFPYGTTAGTTSNLSAGIYVVYINEQSVSSILMSK